MPLRSELCERLYTALTYEKLRTPGYEFKFGDRVRSEDWDPYTDFYLKMENGQRLLAVLHINEPVYFNKLLGEFTGDALLIGGGDKCECGKPERHPNDKFFHVDMDNACNPNVAMNGDYIKHLRVFPAERFGLFWIERCNLFEMVNDESVFSQYFRIAKPGAIFVYQTFVSKKSSDRNFDKLMETLSESLRRYKFAILEDKKYEILEGDEVFRYNQLIFMKPFKINEASKDPFLGIDLNNYRKPKPTEQVSGYIRAKLQVYQMELMPVVPLETIQEWLRTFNQTSAEIASD